MMPAHTSVRSLPLQSQRRATAGGTAIRDALHRGPSGGNGRIIALLSCAFSRTGWRWACKNAIVQYCTIIKILPRNDLQPLAFESCSEKRFSSSFGFQGHFVSQSLQPGKQLSFETIVVLLLEVIQAQVLIGLIVFEHVIRHAKLAVGHGQCGALELKR